MCGKGKLFSRYLKIVAHCAHCGAALGEQDTGDGPAVFVILVVGFLVVAGALIVEVKYTPPYWVHAVLWLPSIGLCTFLLLPLFKAVMFAVRFRYAAGEGIEVPRE